MKKNKNFIDFVFEDIKIPEFDKAKIKKWLIRILDTENASQAYIQYIFCTDNRIYDLNVNYLDHDTLTDIITFNYNEEFGSIAGDIFISYDRIVENAKTYGTTSMEELCRVMAHGILHLLGYNDKHEADTALMRDKENYYLSLL